MKKQNLYFGLGAIVTLLVLAFFLYNLGQENKELKKNSNNYSKLLEKDSILEKQFLSLKTKYLIDSATWSLNLRDSVIIRIKYTGIKERIKVMNAEETVRFFYKYVAPKCNLDSMEIVEGKILIQDTTLQEANLLFVERDYYKELSDTLQIRIMEAKGLSVTQNELVSILEKKCASKDNLLIENNKTLLNLSIENQELKGDNKKLKNKLVKLQFGSVAGIAVLTAVCIAIF